MQRLQRPGPRGPAGNAPAPAMWQARTPCRGNTIFARLARIVRDQPVGDVDRAIGVAGHFGVVGHEDDRDALGVQPLEHPQDLVAGPRIEVAGRFVGQQQCGAIDQGPGDGDPLLLAAGHLRRLVVHAIGQPDLLEQRLGQPPRLAAGRPPQGVVQAA